MRVALVNPYWTYDGSIYFGCRHPHLPLELGYSKSLLEAAGHEVLILDGQLQEMDNPALADAVTAFAPGMTVVTTAPTYLFWRCAPPELRRSEEHTSELQSLMRISYAVFCLKKKTKKKRQDLYTTQQT